MNEDKVRETIARGVKADWLLENEAFQEACAGLRKTLIDRWEISRDTMERDRIWHCVSLIEQIKQSLATFSANARLSRRELDRLTGIAGRQ